MRNQYREIMENIEVTDEMADRILANIRSMDAPKKTRQKFPVQRILAAAACLAVVIGSVFALPTVWHRAPENPPILSPGVSGIVEAASLEELSQQVGFSVAQLTHLPFTPERTRYVSYEGSLAQITYTAQEGSLIFRQAAGEDDISGDYTQYPFSETVSIGTDTVVLKGNEDGQFALALWQSDGFSYSIKSDIPVSLSQWEHILEGIS